MKCNLYNTGIRLCPNVQNGTECHFDRRAALERLILIKSETFLSCYSTAFEMDILLPVMVQTASTPLKLILSVRMIKHC